jgi:hypothetical protein
VVNLFEENGGDTGYTLREDKQVIKKRRGGSEIKTRWQPPIHKGLLIGRNINKRKEGRQE